MLKRSASEGIARLGRDRCALLIVVLAGLGTAHILVRTATYGAAVTVDSVVFLSTALNFLAGEGWRYFTGSPMVGWPPLFPLLLTASGWVGIDPVAASRWINATAFGLTILAAGGWLRSNLRSRWLVLAATAAIAASLPLSRWASHIKAEPLFVLFPLLASIQLAAFLHRGGRTPLLLAAVFTALAALTRWPGVALIGTGVLVLLPLARWKHTLVFGAVSSLPLLAILAHNWAITGHLTQATGHRTEPSRQSLFAGLHQTVEVVREWIVPLKTPDGLAYLLGMTVAAIVLISAAAVLRGRQPDPEAAPPSFGLGPALPFGAFTVGYIAFMAVVVPFTVTQTIDSRYLLPIYVPLLLTAAFLLDRFLSIEATGRMATVRYVVASLVALGTLAHVGFSAGKNLILTAQAWRAGYEHGTYNAASWQQSETLQYLRDHHIEGRIYTNSRELAWFWDRTAAPEKLGKYQNTPRAMRWTKIEAGARIIWFDAIYNRSFLGHDDTDLRVLPGVEVVAELADGVVFRRTATEPFDVERHRARKRRYAEQLIEQADEQVIRAGWGVYRTGRKLTYRKEPCAPADVQAKFVLHIIPADPADLPAHRERYGYDNLGFYFGERGERVGDQCMMIVRLPAYAIGRIRVGQWIAAGNRTLWEAEFPPSR